VSKELVPSFDDELPSGWQVATIGDLISPDGIFIDGDWVESKDQDPNGDVRLLQLADIGDGFYKNKSSRFLTKERAVELKCTFLKKGDILVARMPDPLGRACIFPGDEKECVTVVDVCVIRTGIEDVNHKWLLYWVNSPRFRNTISSLQSGTTRRRISRGNLATITFPVPPPEQQKRIVAKIEELFSHIDAGIAALNKAKQLLKQYRQSVLKAAVTGELTKQWREENKNKLEPASQLLERILQERRQKWEAQQLEQFKAKGKMPKDDKWKGKYVEPVGPGEVSVPTGWVAATLDQITEYITSGSRGWAKYYSDNGATFIRAQNLKYDELRLDDVAFVTLPNSAEGMRTRVKLADVLITITGANVTKTGIVDINIDEGYVSQHVALCRPVFTEYSEYLYQYLISKDGGRKHLESAAYGAGKPGLNLENIKTLSIPLPSVIEQGVMMSIVSERLSKAERVDQEIYKQLLKADKNKQSILASAFTGKL